MRKVVINLHSIMLLEFFLISAVGAVLLIRLYLTLTGFPQIGGNGLHIAHMLWGGLLMLIAVIASLITLMPSSKKWIAILGGIGFGTFIDELGKFITSDNNYFFHPTVSVIYLLFVIIFLFIKFLSIMSKHGEMSYRVNILELLKEAVDFNISDNEKKMILNYSKKLSSKDPVAILAKSIISQSIVVNSKQSIFKKTMIYLNKYYLNLISKKIFVYPLIFYFLFSTILSLILILFIIFNLDKVEVSIFNWIQLIAILASGLLVVSGIFNFILKRRSKMYEFFLFAILINIFIIQFFQFFDYEFVALIGFCFNIIVYSILRTKLNLLGKV